VPLWNPYLDFFRGLPPSCRRDQSLRLATADSTSAEWLTLKGAIARHFAWAVPTDEAIACIGAHTDDLIEIGAGSGYWAWLLRQDGVAVDAFDVAPPPFTWSHVGTGDERVLVSHPASTLFLCWPPWATDMAANALALFEGAQVIYVGEWMLGSANVRFFQDLVSRYAAIAWTPLPQWHGRSDCLTVFRRR
jgi:hypothetical protein